MSAVGGVATAGPRPSVGPRAVPLWDYVERSGLSSVVFGASKDPNAKLTVVLHSSSGDAVCAVKVPTSAAAARAVGHELAILRHLGSLGLADIDRTIPRVLDVVEFEGRTGGVMSAVAGVPMSAVYMRGRHTARPACVAADFDAVAGWLELFHGATASGRTIALDMGEGVSARLRERFAAEPIGPVLDRLTAVYARLAAETVAETAVHGDLWMGNVLVDGRRLSGVVDWEAAAAEGQPVRDLARFAYFYALYLDRRVRPGRRVPGHGRLRSGDWGVGVRYALFGSGWFPLLFRDFLERGLSRLGAPGASYRDAVVAAAAEVTATTDDDDFARSNFELLRGLLGVAPQAGSATAR